MKIQQADENHGFSKNIKAWAASLWSHIEQVRREKRFEPTAGDQVYLVIFEVAVMARNVWNQ